MTTVNPETTSAATDSATPEPVTPAAAAPTDPPKETDWKAEARKWEDRAKQNKAELDAAAPRLAQYDALEQASKSDLEKAQETAAKAAERATAADTRAVKAEIRSLAAGRFIDRDVPFAYLSDPGKYIKDGDIDEAAIAADLDALLTRIPTLAASDGRRTPAPNPAQGSSPSGAPNAEAEAADALKRGDTKAYIAIQNKRLAELAAQQR